MGRFCKNEVLPPPFRGLLRGILCCPAFLFAIACAAYDFSAESSGATLYYSIISETDSVEVAAADISSEYPEIVIPDSVKYTPSGDGEEKTYYVKSIAAAAFAENTSLTKITIPETVTTIDEKAFENCSALTTVVFNAKQCGSAKNIFAGCNAISTLTFGENVTVIPDNFLSSVSSDDDYYGTSKSDTLIVTNFPNLETITIPNSVIYVGTYAFAMNAGLTTLTIGTGVLYIRQDAFADCPNLATVNYNATACSSDGYHGSGMNFCAFWNDTNLSTFTIADNVTSIPNFLLYGEYSHGFPSLTEINIPNGVTTIGESAFRYCQKLETLTLGTSLQDINYYAFAYCPSLKKVTIPDCTVNLGDSVFVHCTAMDSLTIGAGVRVIGKNAFDDCKSLKTVYYNAKNCSSIEWATETSAWSNIFYGIPLENFYIGETVDTIPYYLVNGQWFDYSNFKTLTIPANVKYISANAFNQTYLETVICEGFTPAECSSNSFSKKTNSIVTWLVVPEDAAENYGSSHRATKATATGWSTMTHMREASVTIKPTNADGYTTRYSPYSYNTDSNVTAYAVSGVTKQESESDENEESVTYVLNTTQVDSEESVPAGTAVLLKGLENCTDTTYVNYTYNDNSSTTYSGTNYLHGTVDSGTKTTLGDDDTDALYYFYMLSLNANNDPDSHGFYWGEKGGAPFETLPDRAWLAIAKSDLASAEGKAISIIIGTPNIDDDTENQIEAESEEQTTGISSVTTMPGDAVIYNMSGQRMKEMTRSGVYIVNGKKVVRL